MDSLPHSVLLEILSRLDDSADVARCRVASKGFNTVFPGLRSIHLQCSKEWYNIASSSQRIKPFKTVLLDLTSKLEIVESICIRLSVFLSQGFVIEWLPRVSGSLKSLSITDDRDDIDFQLPKFNLVNLTLSLNPMPMLTSLTLEHLKLEDEDLNELNKCFPNLQFLKLVDLLGAEHPKIHLLNLKTCFWKDFYDDLPSLTIITPKLVTLTLELVDPLAIHIEAPMLSHFILNVNNGIGCELELKKFENLKTLWLKALDIGFFLPRFPITKTVETLTLVTTENDLTPPGVNASFEVILGKVFAIFPNLSSLFIEFWAWVELEAWLKPQCREILYGWEDFETNCPCCKCLNSDTWLEIVSRSYPQSWDGRKGLKRFCSYLILSDPKLTFLCLACVLEQCVGLLEVSLLIISIHVHGDVSKAFMSKCMDHWPRLKWRWGMWSSNMEDFWITDAHL